MKSVDALGSVDGDCDTSNHSVSDRVCKPNATVVGFMGGHGDYPSYFSNYTALNYSETLRLEYNESLLSYKQIMDTYWKFSPDPTYPEGDPAYMLRIFVNSPQQRQIAEDSIHQKQLRVSFDLLPFDHLIFFPLVMASEQQLVISASGISASDWPILPGQKATAVTQSKKSWGALDRKSRSSEVSTSCDTSCASDDDTSRGTGDCDDAGYTSDEGPSWNLSANAPAFVPCGVTVDKTRLDSKAAVFVPGACPPVVQAAWQFPIAVRPPPGLEEVPTMVQTPPGLRAGLSTKAKAFVPKVDL